MYRAGIIGLPNVGKSSLFNALIKNHHAEVQNYPFCTIDPNVGIVNLNDERLEKIAKIVKTTKIVPAAFEFVDIAGLVKGASKGEGLGNKFLSHVREVDALVHVVRCFIDPNITHIDKLIDPIRDIEIINMELILSDLQSIEKKIESVARQAKGNDKTSKHELEILEKISAVLNVGNPARLILKDLPKEDLPFYNSLFLLTNKPVIYAANVLDNDLASLETNEFYKSVKNHAEKTGSRCVPICAKLGSDLIEFNEDEEKSFISELGIKGTGISELIKGAFDLLGLMTYFTAGEKEAKAWTILKNTKAPQAAGVIHTDFERGFIKAEVMQCDDLLKLGSKPAVREAGLARLEGKDYVVRDGDIIEFKFNV